MKESEIRVESEIGRATETALVQFSIPEQDPKLIECLSSIGGGIDSVTGSLEICVSTANGEQSETVVHERSAGVYAAFL